jgi:hypothetical protein
MDRDQARWTGIPTVSLYCRVARGSGSGRSPPTKRLTPNACISMAPVRRRSCGVHAPRLPAASTSVSSWQRFAIGLRGEPSRLFLKRACRSPTCLLIDLTQTCPSLFLAGKHQSECRLISFNARNWARANGDRNRFESSRPDQ